MLTSGVSYPLPQAASMSVSIPSSDLRLLHQTRFDSWNRAPLLLLRLDHA
ncbi:unnamed protein product [Brassica rapa subsp. trilocularis]